jgi:hypothetical protein
LTTDLYYRDCVIGGPGAFMVPVRERDQFVEAVKTKLIREIPSVLLSASFSPRKPNSRPTALQARWQRLGSTEP